jgi:hypothetical protein
MSPPPNPLIRKINAADMGLQLNRVEIDGLPFRGTFPVAPEAELEERLVPVVSAQVALFDLTAAEDRRSYRNLLEGAARGWFTVTFIKRHVDLEANVFKVYAEWVERNMADGKALRGTTDFYSDTEVGGG